MPIAEASIARYAPDIESDVSAARLARYFARDSDGYTVRQEIRQLVVFANHNMISDPPFSNIDLICCRNVLIYFRHSVQQKIIAAFHFSLKRDGFVFFGSSETIGELKSHFEPLDERLRLFRKASAARLPVPRARAGGNLSRRPPASAASRCRRWRACSGAPGPRGATRRSITSRTA